MVSNHALQIIADDTPGPVLDALFSAAILRHPAAIPGRLPREELTEFSHHLLFDYAAELLFIRPRRSDLAGELAENETWGLFLRPSLMLFFRYMWKHGRLDFWDTLIELERRSVPLLHRMLAHLIVAEEVSTREDLQPTLTGALSNSDERSSWEKTIQGTVAAATFSSLPKLFKRGAGEWWIKFATDLVRTSAPTLVYAGQKILFSAADDLESLPIQSRRLLNEGAIHLIEFHRSESPIPDDRIKPAIGWASRTMAAAPSRSVDVIRGIIDQRELRRAGFIQAHEVTRNIRDIWRVDSDLAVEVYDAIFRYVESEKTATSLGGSQILPMTSNRKQYYEVNHYLLCEAFGEFLAEHPKEATRALIRVLHHCGDYPSTDEGFRAATFEWNGHQCQIDDLRRLPFISYGFLDEHEKMLAGWVQYLVDLPSHRDAKENGKRLRMFFVKKTR